MKAVMLRLHRYVGLTMAAFLFVQAATGLTLLFGPQLAQWLDPAGMVSGGGNGEARPAQLVAAAEARHPGMHLDRLVFPSRPDGTYLVHLADADGTMRYVSLDRHNAAVLRDGSLWRFPVVAALNIHDQWLSGTPGTVLVAVAGLALLFMAASGLVFWWPRRGRIGKSLAINRNVAPRLVLRQLHRTVGVVGSSLLLFMAITGLFLAVPMVIDGTAAPWSAEASFASRIEPALLRAEQAFPGHRVRDIRVSAPTTIAVFLFAPERNGEAVHQIVVDTATGRIKSVRNAFADRAPWVIALPLHDGSALGPFGTLLPLVAGASLAGLAASGPLMWWQLRRRRRRPAAAGRTAAQSGA